LTIQIVCPVLKLFHLFVLSSSKFPLSVLEIFCFVLLPAVSNVTEHFTPILFFFFSCRKEKKRKHVKHCIRKMDTILYVYTYKPQANEQQHLQQKSEVRMRSIPVAGATLFGPRATTLKSTVKKSREIRNCSLMLDKSNRPIPIFAGLWEI